LKKEKLELRKTIIKLHQKGKKQTEISDLLDVPQSTVSYWIIRYRQTGSLEDNPRPGCPSRLDNKQFKELRKVLLDSPPLRFGGESFGWTTKMAIQYIKDNFGVEYGMRQMEKLFHKFELNLITPRVEHRKGSNAARTVFCMDFKKNSKRNIWIASSLISMK